MNIYLPVIIAATLSLTACRNIEEVTGHSPIIDTSGVNLAQYDVDLMECQAYADQVEVGRQAATGAVSGAVVGGVVGAAVGDSDTASRAAGVGAVGGATRGVSSGLRERQRVIRNCLRGRGYRVLN